MLTYLAAPYSDPDPLIREQRYKAITKQAGLMMKAGRYIFSPITHTAPIAQAVELPESWEFWEAYDRIMLGKCDIMTVLCLDGWPASVGVEAEIKIAKEIGIPIEYLWA